MGRLRDELIAAQTAREAFEAQRESSLIQTRSTLSANEHSLTILLAGMAAFYLVARFGFTQKLDAMGEYVSYFLEIGLVAFSVALLRPRLAMRSLVLGWSLGASFIALASGFAILKIARLSGIAVPININSRETVFFLLAVAPVLEEAIFRFLLWKPLLRIWNSQVAMLASAVLFSYSHLHEIWFVPAEYDKFLIFQTAYTLVLGLACGWIMRRTGSLLPAILLHFAFNLGFYLAF